jgi:hypothetical protein
LTYPVCYQALLAESSGIQRSGTKPLTAEIAELPAESAEKSRLLFSATSGISLRSLVKSFRLFSP